MYAALLTIHSLFRWLVLGSLLYAIFRSYRGIFSNQSFSRVDDTVRQAATRIAEVQFLIGLSLYLSSPIVDHFLHHFKEAIHNREIRFFGMEHGTMMLIAVAIISIGSGKVQRKTTDKQKFKAMAIWFTVALLIIFLSIPWKFSPLISRPYFRIF